MQALHILMVPQVRLKVNLSLAPWASCCCCVCATVLQLQTPPANLRLAPAEKAALQAIWRNCCPVTKGLEAPDVCSTL